MEQFFASYSSAALCLTSVDYHPVIKNVCSHITEQHFSVSTVKVMMSWTRPGLSRVAAAAVTAYSQQQHVCLQWTDTASMLPCGSLGGCNHLHEERVCHVQLPGVMLTAELSRLSEQLLQGTVGSLVPQNGPHRHQH